MKKSKKQILFCTYFLLLLACTITVKSQNVEILFTNIRSTKGQILVKIFKDNQSFKDEKEFMEKKFAKTKISNGTMSVKFDIEPGTYGFALLDDENNNNEMEYNFLGMPKEGYGFSNYVLSGLKYPNFDDFKVIINKNQKVKITMKISYM